MFNWREIPLVRILLPTIIGILLAFEINEAGPFIDYFLLLLLIPFAFLIKEKFKYKHRWIYGLLVSLFFILFGYQLCFYHADWNQKGHFKRWLSTENIVIGTVENTPSKQSKYIKINLGINQIGSERGIFNDCLGTIQLSLLNDKTSRKIAYGDLIISKAKIKSIQQPLNPLAFNYGEYLHLKNIDYQAFVADGDWLVLQNKQGNPILDWAYKMRRSFLDILNENLRDVDEIAVGSALILGYKDGLSEELKTAYANTGAMHVLAVSGLHVGLIWGFVVLLIGWIRWRHPVWKWLKTIIILTCLWLFALITGASPSVLRAATMFSFLIVGTSLGRSVNIYNTLAASAFCLLLYNPFLIKEVGFQLSYFAVIGIVYFQPKVYRLWFIKNKAGNFLWKLTAVAIAAQLTTFPLSLYYFHQFPLYFWLSGIIVVPFAFLILGGGIILFITTTISPPLGLFIGKLLNAIIWLMNALIFLIEQLPLGLFSGIWIGLVTLLCLYSLLLCLSFFIRLKRIKWLFGAMVFVFMICGFYAFDSIENQVQKEIVFYHLPRKTYVEFIDNEEVVSFGDMEIDPKPLTFATKEYHLFKGIESITKYHFGYETIQRNNWMQSNGIIQFFTKKIAFLKHLPSNAGKQKLTVDFVLIRRGASFSLEELNQRLGFKKIIFDASLEKVKRRQWQRACVDRNVPFYDMNSGGALIVNVEK